MLTTALNSSSSKENLFNNILLFLNHYSHEEKKFKNNRNLCKHRNINTKSIIENKISKVEKYNQIDKQMYNNNHLTKTFLSENKYIKVKRRKNNPIINRFYTLNYLIEIIIIQYILINYSFSFIRTDKNIIISHDSIITLKIKKSGFSNVFSNVYNPGTYSRLPSKITINGVNQDTINARYNLEESDNTIELIWTNSYTYSCYGLFSGCADIVEIDLSKFISSQIKIMSHMFFECTSLTSINLANFDTSKVTAMQAMFYRCEKLSSLDVSGFITSNVQYIDNMFRGCLSLTSIDVSHFDTSKVTGMGSMFSSCISLTSIDVSNFDLSKVISVDNMFVECRSLTSIDLSNFMINSVTYMDSIFAGCTNLKYINIKNFIDGRYPKPYWSPAQDYGFTGFNRMFYNVPTYLTICVDTNNPQIMSQLNTVKCYYIDCSDDWKTNFDNIKDNIIDCINNNCLLNNIITNECFEGCKNLYFNQNCKCELEKCLLCTPDSLSHGLCIICNANYYAKENDETNIGEYINCYREFKEEEEDKNEETEEKEEGTEEKEEGIEEKEEGIEEKEEGKDEEEEGKEEKEKSEEENLTEKQCYNACETCEAEGDYLVHNCLQCDSNLKFEIINNDNKYKSCFEDCNHYYYDFDGSKSKIFENYDNIKKFDNLKFLSCYKVLQTKDGLIFNIGFFIILIILLIQIFSIIVFYIKDFQKMKVKIKDISLNTNNINENKANGKQDDNINDLDINNIDNKIQTNDNILSLKKNRQIKNGQNNNSIEVDNNKKRNEMKDYQLNQLSYNMAIEYDKRTYWKYYLSLILTQHPIIFTFIFNNDYNSKIIKISLFFFCFAIHLSMHSIFYNNNIIHHIYINNGSFDFGYIIPQIIYSALISIALHLLLRILVLSNNSIMKFEENKKQKNSDIDEIKLIKKIKITSIIYFILVFIFLIFFYYYLSMFCAIYKKTQIHVLGGALISFLISLIYPFIVYFLIGFFRIYALRDEKKKREFLYSLSKILQNI